MGFGKAVKNFFHGLGSLAETGSWHVEKAADGARSAEILLDHAKEEIEQNAQETLDHVNAGLTYYGELTRKAEMLEKQVADWDAKSKAAASKAKAAADGSPDKEKWVKLTRSALEQKNKFVAELKVVQESVDAAKPDAEKALQMVQEIGFTREQALSDRETLLVANATAKAKQGLAKARQSWGADGGPGKTLDEARQKVNAAIAQARAGEMIADATPASAGAVAAEISREQRALAVDEELDALLK